MEALESFTAALDSWSQVVMASADGQNLAIARDDGTTRGVAFTGYVEYASANPQQSLPVAVRPAGLFPFLELLEKTDGLRELFLREELVQIVAEIVDPRVAVHALRVLHDASALDQTGLEGGDSRGRSSTCLSGGFVVSKWFAHVEVELDLGLSPARSGDDAVPTFEFKRQDVALR